MGHLIAMVGPKGGTGCTTFAVVLARALRKLNAGRVILVEGDLMWGDLATLVGLKPARSLLDILDKPRPWTQNLVRRAVERHPVLDFDVVLAPAESHLAEKITPRHFKDFLGVLRYSYDWVLVDVASNLSERELDTFEAADAIYLLGAPSAVSVSSTRRMIKVFSLLKKPMQKLGVVLNDAPGSPGELTQADVEAGLGVPVALSVPRAEPRDLDYAALRDMDARIPRTEVMKVLAGFADRLRKDLGGGQAAPGTDLELEAVQPSFDPFVSVAGAKLKILDPEQGPAGHIEVHGGNAPSPPQAPPAPPEPAASPEPPPPPPPPAPAPPEPGAQAKAEPDPNRTTGIISLRERLRQAQARGESAPQGPPAPPRPPKPSLPVQRQKGKYGVVVADDNESFRRGLTRALSFEDALQVLAEAGDGEEAVDMVAKHSPELVLLDANMPRLDGLGAARRIQQEHPGVAIVIMSVQGEEDFIRKCLAAGVKKFLLKPFSPDDVTRAVREILG